MKHETYKLAELAEESGMSPRTIRYYVQRGLLPAPEFRGPDTTYDHDHLRRLKAIRRLQDRHLPLDEIAHALAQETASNSFSEDVQPILPSVSRWERLVVLDGVELHVRDDIGSEVRQMIEQWLELAKERVQR